MYPYVSSGITIVSFFDLKDAKRAKAEMQSTYSDYTLLYIKPCFIGESMNETLFITMRSTISDRLDDFDAIVKKKKKKKKRLNSTHKFDVFLSLSLSFSL